MVGSSASVVQAANEYFDALVKSRFIEMFGDESFESKQLFDLFKTSSGGTPLKSKKQYYDGGTIPWLTSGEVDRLHINSARSKITQIALKETSAKIPPIGSVLVSMYGSVGYAGILEFEAAINQAICAIHPNPDFSPEWLCYYVRSKKEELTNQAVGAALNNISQDKIRKLMVPCPPIELQNEFTKFVRQVDKSKLLFQQMVSKYDELVKSRFIEMFGDVYVGTGRWEKQSFCDIVEFNPKKSELPAEDFDVSFVPMECVGTDNSMVPQCTKKKSEVIKGYTYFKNNDVVIAKITPCFENGKIAVAHDLLNGVGFGTTEFHVARPKEGISNPIWILNLLLLNSLKINANQNMTGSAGQKRIQTDYFKRLMVEVPPIELQNQFADFVRQVDKSKSEILEGIKRLKSNRITDNEPNSGS